MHYFQRSREHRPPGGRTHFGTPKHWILIHFLEVQPQQRYSQSGRTGTSQSYQIRQPRRTPVWPTSWADPEVGTGGPDPPPPPPPVNHKNIGFLGNTGPNPLKNHKATNPALNVWPSSARQRKAISMAFRWRADDGPLIVVFWSFLHSS